MITIEILYLNNHGKKFQRSGLISIEVYSYGDIFSVALSYLFSCVNYIHIQIFDDNCTN